MNTIKENQIKKLGIINIFVAIFLILGCNNNEKEYLQILSNNNNLIYHTIRIDSVEYSFGLPKHFKRLSDDSLKYFEDDSRYLKTAYTCSENKSESFCIHQTKDNIDVDPQFGEKYANILGVNNSSFYSNEVVFIENSQIDSTRKYIVSMTKTHINRNFFSPDTIELNFSFLKKIGNRNIYLCLKRENTRLSTSFIENYLIMETVKINKVFN